MPGLTSSRTIFSGAVITAGEVVCAADDPEFSREDHSRGHRVVFPRFGVQIHASGARPYVSDPTVIEYYNDGQEYRRGPIDPRGDRTAWYAVEERVLRELVARYDPTAAASTHPMRFVSAPTDARACAMERIVFRHLVNEREHDALAVEELLLTIVDRALAAAYDKSPAQRSATAAEREIAMRAAAVMAASPKGRITLTALAREAAVSPYHLCRVFHRVTGRTLARAHVELRLISSLGPLLDSESGLNGIAWDHGFSSHSHYGATFRRMFGVTPSELRSLAQRSVRELKMLLAPHPPSAPSRRLLGAKDLATIELRGPSSRDSRGEGGRRPGERHS